MAGHPTDTNIVVSVLKASERWGFLGWMSLASLKREVVPS